MLQDKLELMVTDADLRAAMSQEARKLEPLPRKIKLNVIRADVLHAECGSPTRCTIANAIRRTYPELTFVKVNPNRITVTYGGLVNHFNMPNAGLKIVQENDDGSLELGAARTLTIKMEGNPTAAHVPSEERRVQVNAARDARKAAGNKDKTYKPNYRRIAAKKAGMSYKRLTSA